MKKIERISTLEQVDSIDELVQADRELLLQAREAAGQAYAPYSGFQVGCAIRLMNGEVITGNNQENVAYPSGLCAERVAIFSAGAKWPDSGVECMAITAISKSNPLDHPVLSCGACLQAMTEYETRHANRIRMILQGETGVIYVADGTRTFLPFQFQADALKK